MDPLADAPPAGRVAALWRFPVKSLQGEAAPALAFGPSGVDGDRGLGESSTLPPAGVGQDGPRAARRLGRHRRRRECASACPTGRRWAGEPGTDAALWAWPAAR